MVKVNNSTVIQNITNNAGLQTGSQEIPSELAKQIVPTVEVGTRANRYINIIKTATTGGTGTAIYTTPTDQDFFLVGAQLSVIKDATSTSTSTDLYCTTDESSSSTSILKITGITLTPQSSTVSISFPIPIKCKRGSIIGINNATNVATILSSGCIQGYTVSNSEK